METKQQNKISPEKMQQLINNAEDINAIITMEEGKTMPIYIHGASFKFLNINCDLLFSIIHETKYNTIQIKGRIKYDNGEKTQFINPRKLVYSEMAIESLKKEIKEMKNEIEKNLELTPNQPSFELKFKKNETIENIIQAINNSNKFNIGIMNDNSHNLIDKINA